MQTSRPVADDSSSRFEELPPSPTSSTGSFEDAPSISESPSTSTQPLPSTQPLKDSALEADEDEENEDSVWWTPSELRDILDRSTALKIAGNSAFGKGKYEEALGLYRDGLVELPVRTKVAVIKDEGKGKEKATGEEEGDEKIDKEESVKAVPEVKDESGSDDVEEEEMRELRSILFANVAACLLKLERWKDAVTACDDALEVNPNYIKALTRRATASEAIASWASLTSALADQKKILDLPDVPLPTIKAAKSAEQRLPGLLAAAQEKEKDEVLGKLKDLGNTLLGKFGLSTENFKFTEQPGGGYSMNFER